MSARPTSRIARREALLTQARATELAARVDVCVVGGGAAGLVAAITAAEQGARTVVVERDLECGRTILATGGGRCNFANRDLVASYYNNPDFVEAVVDDDFLGQVLRFFRASGLAWCEEEGRLYPASLSAASVRDVLLARAERAGVTFACAREVVSVDAANGEWRVTTNGPLGEESLNAEAVIFASGGGVTLGESLLPVNEPQPMLCPIACSGLPFGKLDGQRVHAELRLMRDGNEILRERGELLFRPYGLSGICAFNLSRFAEADDVILLDLAPELEMSQLDYLVGRAGSLAGVVSPQIAAALAGAGFGAADIKALPCTVLGLTETDHAQVTRGGFVTSSFDPTTLAAVALPGIFAAGEALDVDGPCGGYNLSWAWVSGQVAGTSAAAWATDKEARNSRS